MGSGGIDTFLRNLASLPGNFRKSAIRHGSGASERTRSQAIFGNFFLHIHATRTHPHSLRPTTTWGLGVSLISQFIILTVTGVLLMVYYKASAVDAYRSIEDLQYVVPAGRIVRNIHRWAAHLMVACVILHMARVFYVAAYKAPREFNWLIGMLLLVLTLLFSFTGYLLPWDQLAFWAITVGVNVAASTNELAYALGLPQAFHLGDVARELLLGASHVGQEALTRFYLLHIVGLPIVFLMALGLHVWRIRKDGGMVRPQEAMAETPPSSTDVPTKSYGLMAAVKGTSPHTGKDLDETLPSWPYLLRAELLVFMGTMLACIVLGILFDAPLGEPANPAVPENPAKAPWYFLGLQEMVSYSAFAGGIAIPAVIIVGLALIPYLDREEGPAGVWFSGAKGRRTALLSVVFAAVAAVLAVAIPVRWGWLRDWFPNLDAPLLLTMLLNPGTALTAVYVLWSLGAMQVTRSTRLGAVALFTCALVGYVVLTYVGTFLRGPDWGFYWSQAGWPPQ